MMVRISLTPNKIGADRFIINLVKKFFALFCWLFFSFLKQQQEYDHSYRNESLTQSCLPVSEGGCKPRSFNASQRNTTFSFIQNGWCDPIPASAAPTPHLLESLSLRHRRKLSVPLPFYRTFTFAYSTDSLRGHIPPNVITLHLKYERYNRSMKIFLPRWRLAPAVA